MMKVITMKKTTIWLRLRRKRSSSSNRLSNSMNATRVAPRSSFSNSLCSLKVSHVSTGINVEEVTRLSQQNKNYSNEVHHSLVIRATDKSHLTLEPYCLQSRLSEVGNTFNYSQLGASTANLTVRSCISWLRSQNDVGIWQRFDVHWLWLTFAALNSWNCSLLHPSVTTTYHTV